MRPRKPSPLRQAPVSPPASRPTPTPLPRQQHVRVEAGAVAGVAGRARLVDDHQQRVAVAVEPHLAHVLDVPGGLALDPVLLAAARPVGPRPVVSVRCSASSSIQATISTSRVPRCWATAANRPSVRLQAAGGDRPRSRSIGHSRLTHRPPPRRAQRVLDLADPQLAEVEDAGRQHGVRAGRDRRREVVHRAGAAAGDHRHVDRRAHGRGSSPGRSRPWCRRRPSS